MELGRLLVDVGPRWGKWYPRRQPNVGDGHTYTWWRVLVATRSRAAVDEMRAMRRN